MCFHDRRSQFRVFLRLVSLHSFSAEKQLQQTQKQGCTPTFLPLPSCTDLFSPNHMCCLRSRTPAHASCLPCTPSTDPHVPAHQHVLVLYALADSTSHPGLLVVVPLGPALACLLHPEHRAQDQQHVFLQQVPSPKPSAALGAAVVPGHGLSPVTRSLSSGCQRPRLSPVPWHGREGHGAGAVLWPGAHAPQLEKLFPPACLPCSRGRGVQKTQGSACHAELVTDGSLGALVRPRSHQSATAFCNMRTKKIRLRPLELSIKGV